MIWDHFFPPAPTLWWEFRERSCTAPTALLLSPTPACSVHIDWQTLGVCTLGVQTFGIEPPIYFLLTCTMSQMQKLPSLEAVTKTLFVWQILMKFTCRWYFSLSSLMMASSWYCRLSFIKRGENKRGNKFKVSQKKTFFWISFPRLNHWCGLVPRAPQKISAL